MPVGIRTKEIEVTTTVQSNIVSQEVKVEASRGSQPPQAGILFADAVALDQHKEPLDSKNGSLPARLELLSMTKKGEIRELSTVSLCRVVEITSSST